MKNKSWSSLKLQVSSHAAYLPEQYTWLQWNPQWATDKPVQRKWSWLHVWEMILFCFKSISMYMFTISAIIIIKYSKIPPNLALSIIVLLVQRRKKIWSFDCVPLPPPPAFNRSSLQWNNPSCVQEVGKWVQLNVVLVYSGICISSVPRCNVFV